MELLDVAAPVSHHFIDHSDEHDDFSLETIDGVLRQVVRNRTAVQGQRLLGHSGEHDDDFSLEVRNLNVQNQTVSFVLSDSGERDNISTEDRIISQDAQNRTVILERHSNERDDVSVEILVPTPNGDGLLRHSEEIFSLEDRMDFSTPVPDQKLVLQSNEHDDLSLENVNLKFAPTDNKQKMLLKEFAQDVIDDLFSSERGVGNSAVRFNEMTSNSFRTADAHSAFDSAFFEHQTAGAPPTASFFLPLLIACLLLNFS